MTRAARCSMASIPRSNSAPLIPPAGSSTVSSANRLAESGQIHPQIPPTRLENNPDDKVSELIVLGQSALNVEINVKDEIVAAAQGSFYLAQMLSREVCKRGGI